jgi:hypothetical protein
MEQMKTYQDDAGWRVGDGVNQVSQVFPSEEAAKKYIEKRLRSRASFDRAMKYPGKIIPVEWLESIRDATAHKPDPIEVYYPDTEQTKECGWCHQMNNESNSFCWHCEGEI